MKNKLCEYFMKVKAKASLAVVMSLLCVEDAFAGLPAGFTPTGGGGSATDPAANLMAWCKEIGGYVIALVAAVGFIMVVIEAISTFGEARKNNHWTKFGICIVVGIVLIILVLWMLNEASTTLT